MWKLCLKNVTGWELPTQIGLFRERKTEAGGVQANPSRIKDQAPSAKCGKQSELTP